MSDPLLSMTMVGDSEAKNRLAGFTAQVKMVAWADRVGPKILDALKEEAPEGKGPGAGRLKNSIKFERSSSLGISGVTLKFHTDVPYAASVIDGALPHTISATSARFLQFPDKDGTMIYRTSVNHPGIKNPNRFNDRALERMLPEIASSFGAIFEGI